MRQESNRMNVEVIPEPICGCDAEAESYDAWFRAKVEKSIADPTPAMPHNEAMAFVDKELKRRNDERLAESISQAERGEFVEVEL